MNEYSLEFEVMGVLMHKNSYGKVDRGKIVIHFSIDFGIIGEFCLGCY